MSIKAAKSSVNSTQEILCINGQSALSNFRIKKLNTYLKDVGDGVEIAHTNYKYFIKLNLPLGGESLEKLSTLLLSGEKAMDEDAESEHIIVVPRLGTISSWSSKATDIAHACGLEAIDRIERGICFSYHAPIDLDNELFNQIKMAIHDRMTESVLPKDFDPQNIFLQQQPEKLNEIELVTQGKQALEIANTELGLALSDDEIDYLCNHYERMQRNPTDAELMMFAQANSEHCRHKIFNADWVIDGKPQSEKLFSMIKSTTEASPKGVISAYSDNAAVIEGFEIDRLMSSTADREFVFTKEPTHIVMKLSLIHI